MLNEIDLSRADLNLLVLFEAVMAERHVGRAAERLNLSPSAVSHGLGRLRRLLNDPLYLRTPRGVVPTDRALELAPRIDAALAAVRGVIASAEPFDPATSVRRFRVGMADASLCVYGPGLVAALEADAPGIAVSAIHVLRTFGKVSDDHAWDEVLAMLDAGTLDVALLPWVVAPARFAVREVGRDRLMAACRADHPYASDPTLDTYCASRHLVVSVRGDPVAATDASLAALGRSRRVMITAPNFSVAMFLAAECNLVVSLPETLIEAQGARFGLVGRPLPFDLPYSRVVAVATRAALGDEGIAWLVGALARLVAATARA
ncbi:MAG: LysR family transcriptional regulator [Rhodobacteraceae bacterium]|jgi:DNA-binding transcriptional LysR family regulator|nr:LysR family transcriptional regulator [Paracoccaceae bacterium]